MPTLSLKRHVRPGNSNNADHRAQKPRQPNRKDNAKVKGNAKRKDNAKLRNKGKVNARTNRAPRRMAGDPTVKERARMVNSKEMASLQTVSVETRNAPILASQTTAPTRDQARIKTCPKLRVIRHSRRIHLSRVALAH